MDYSILYKPGMSLGDYKEAYKNMLVIDYYYLEHYMNNIKNEYDYELKISHYSVNSNGKFKIEDGYILHSDYSIFLINPIKVMLIYDYSANEQKTILPANIIDSFAKMNPKYKNIIYISNNINKSELFNDSKYKKAKYHVLCKYFNEFSYLDISNISDTYYADNCTCCC